MEDKRKLEPNKNKRNSCMIILLTIAVICLGTGLLKQERKNRVTMQETKKQEEPMDTFVPSKNPETTKEALPATQEPIIIEKYKELLEVNQDVVGMITIPDTKISSYPVLIGADNEFYLAHNINMEKSKHGCIYVDYLYGKSIATEFQRHTLIYGHNMKDNSMFGQVVEYKKKDFFENHEYIYFDNLYETGKWKVFSVYVVDADKETIKRTHNSDEEYLSFLKNIKLKSQFKVDVSLTAESKIITLCTCSYETENSRTIVHAVRINE